MTQLQEAGAGRMSENEIRPDDLIKGQAERFGRDVERMLRRRAEFVAVPCPACGERAGLPDAEFRKFTLDYLRCGTCRTLYISPRPSPSVLDEYYRTSENYAYWNRYIFPASEAVRREKIFKPRAQRVLDICRRHGVATQGLLEVGAGFGTFCEEVQRLGAFGRVLAVEPTPGLAETCRQRGVTVVEKPVEQVEAADLGAGAVNVIACFEVIEHLFAPAEFVRQCARLLEPGGLFIATCPNVFGFDIAELKALSSAVDPEHLNYFHPASLSRLVRACGFEVLEVQTPGKLDAELVRKKALAGEIDLSGRPFLHRVLIEEWERVGADFQEFLARNGLSSHMWLVARKRAQDAD